jgi:rubrerythrin
MARYIDAEALKRHEKDVYGRRVYKAVFVEDIDAALTADVAPVVYAKRIDEGRTAEIYGPEYQCPICGDSMIGDTNFCPNCGAKMDG